MKRTRKGYHIRRSLSFCAFRIGKANERAQAALKWTLDMMRKYLMI